MEQPQGKERWDLLAEMAHLYYNEHLTQAQIGERPVSYTHLDVYKRQE